MSYAPFAPLSLECHKRPSSGALAQSVSVVAHRDLLWREDDADWIPGILGISLARARQPMALSKVDGRDGALYQSQAEEGLSSRFNISCFQVDLLKLLLRNLET